MLYGNLVSLDRLFSHQHYNIFFIFFKIHPGTQNLALHYNVLVGVEWYGKGRNLYFIPGIGLAITAVNFTLYRALKDNRFFLAELTAYVSIFVQIILLIAAMFLARVNETTEIFTALQKTTELIQGTVSVVFCRLVFFVVL